MIVALAGGVGGARLAHGLVRALPPDSLSVIVNTGDDFDHYGLRVCPDLDTVMYTLSGLANEATGWGVVSDTDSALGMLRRYGEDAWFWLGDRDMATCLLRTERLRAGQSLSAVTAAMASALGVHSVAAADERRARRYDRQHPRRVRWPFRSISSAAIIKTLC